MPANILVFVLVLLLVVVLALVLALVLVLVTRILCEENAQNVLIFMVSQIFCP